MVRILLIVLAGTMSLSAYGQQFNVQRKWSDSTGKFSVEASMHSFDETSVELYKPDGKVIRIPRSRLSEADSEFVSAVVSIQQTESQAALLLPHLEQAVEHPVATAEIIDALRAEYPSAVGGHLLAGVVYATAGTESSNAAKSSYSTKSQRCLEEALKTIEPIENHFPGLYRKTMASVLNNRAVLALRQGNILGGINFLVQAAEVSQTEISVAVYHNSSLLLNSEADLGTGREKLAKILAIGKPEATGQIPDYLMFSLDHDSFSTSSKPKSSASESQESTSGAAPGKFLVAYGSGFLIDPTLVLTNRHVAEDCSGFRIRNDSGLVINARIMKMSNSEDIDLAVLKLEQPVASDPLPIRQDVPSIGESFVVLGYPIPQLLEASLTASRGIVSKLVTENLQILHDASTDPGNSGGPCIDDRGNVIGVHFAGRLVSSSNRNYAISPVAIKMFLSSVPEYKVVPLRTESLDFSNVIAKNKDSVFMIECYSDQIPADSQRSAQSQSTSITEKYALIPDRTCLHCFGKGYVDCLACVKGYNSEKRTVEIGYDILLKKRIMGEKNFKVPCRRCRRGSLPCPACKGSGNRN